MLNEIMMLDSKNLERTGKPSCFFYQGSEYLNKFKKQPNYSSNIKQITKADGKPAE